jgi:hypothetical protein
MELTWRANLIVVYGALKVLYNCYEVIIVKKSIQCIHCELKPRVVSYINGYIRSYSAQEKEKAEKLNPVSYI